MDKLLWVAMPLVLALAALGWWTLRGRAPSRHGLNVGFSVLLLGYVAGTAGLGIFWVANQQLPVFEWHYLFGYATVLLLLIHLAFNLRIVVRFVRRKLQGPGAVAALPAASAAEGGNVTRRPLLGAFGAGGVAIAAGLGYLLGLRHGRTELALVENRAASANDGAGASAATATASNETIAVAAAAASSAWAVVEQFHAFSGHSRTGVLRHAASTDWGLAPPPFKRYPDAPRLALPAARSPTAAARGPFGLAALGSCLWHTAGISDKRGGIHFRCSPSSGALFATELYVLALDVEGLERGPWHYEPQAHALQRLAWTQRGAAGDRDAAFATEAFGPLELPPAPRAVVVASAIFARSGHKYGDRTYRYVSADLGHALENLRVAARAHGAVHCHLLARFDEQAIGGALGLDAQREGVLAVAALAGGARVADPAPTTPPAPATDWTSPVRDAFAAKGGRLGVTEAMQLATSLRAAPAAAAPAASAPRTTAAAAPTPGRPALDPLAPRATLPAPRRLDADWLQVVAKRRSVRRFANAPIEQQALADILQAMTAPAPVLSGAVRIDLLSTAVAGLEPAAWRLDSTSASGRPPALALVRRAHHGAALRAHHDAALRAHHDAALRAHHDAALRARARAAALDQDVIGDAAVVFVLSLDRAALRADPVGPARAYRHGFIEAGLVGERLYLAAGALGLAVCAVGAFYDDEAAALVGIDPAREWVVHFAALGVPA
jgi:SagB-type dehydrogenase family enzyme